MFAHFDSNRSDLSTLKYSNKELKADIEKCKNWWSKELGDGSFDSIYVNIIEDIFSWRQKAIFE